LLLRQEFFVYLQDLIQTVMCMLRLQWCL